MPLILTTGLQRLRQGLAGVPALQKDMHHIPLEQFREVISKCAVRGIIRYPRIKASGLQRVGWIQRYHKLLWAGLDHEEKAIALGVSGNELRAAINHPPVDVLD